MEHFRVKEASKYFGVSIATIWMYSKQGKITAIKLSDRVTVWAKSDLDSFIASRMMAVA